MKQWTTGEVSRLRDISVRTLRYYDQINLLKPSFKESSGKRFYSEEDLLRLEKIIILKSLSLPLEHIRSVLEELSYKQILMSHYHYLREQQAKLEESMAYTTALINMIDLEKKLSWEHVTEVVNISQRSSKKWIDYFQEDEKVILKHAIPSLSKFNDINQQYISILQRIEWCLKHNVQPRSEEGGQIGSELIKLTNDTFQGDSDLMDKFWEVRKLPAEETGLYPISDDVLEFVELCMAYVSE